MGKEIGVPAAPAPRLYLDLEGKNVGQEEGLEVGEKVKILVTGTVKGLSQRQRQDHSNAKKTISTGSIELENYSVKVLEEDKNLYTKMSKEDD